MAQEAFESITLGHLRSHGCRDLLLCCGAISRNHSVMKQTTSRLASALTRTFRSMILADSARTYDRAVAAHRAACSGFRKQFAGREKLVLAELPKVAKPLGSRPGGFL